MAPNRKYAVDALIVQQIFGGYWLPELSTGRIYSRTAGRYLISRPHKDGYLFVLTMSGVDVPVARVIWIAAHGIPELDYLQIDHINENKQDNRIDNLRLLTPSGNQMHSNSLFTFEEAETIRRKYDGGNYSLRALGREYGVSPVCIRRIVRNETYRTADESLNPLNLSEETMKNVFHDICYAGNSSFWVGQKYKIPISAIEKIIVAESQRIERARRR